MQVQILPGTLLPTMPFTVATPVSAISQVGKTTASRLAKLGIFTVEDLIFYYPFRYEDFSQIVPLARLQIGDRSTVKVKIELINNRRSWKKKTSLTEAIVVDPSGSIKAIWFNQPYLTKLLQPGEALYLAGKVDTDGHTLQLVNPIYEKVKTKTAAIHTARLVPIYSVTQSLSQKQIRWLISLALKAVNQITDWLPPKIIKDLGLMGLAPALSQIHFPANQKALAAAIRRLKFNELFLFSLQTQTIKRELQLTSAPVVKFQIEATKDFVSRLPFVLTLDQKKAAWQIMQDLQRSRPMNRLLEGEVGSGKTVVAALAALNSGLNHYQSVLMAPTEILAQQHFITLKKLLAATPLKVALVTHAFNWVGPKPVSKARLLTLIKNDQVDLIVGTHALIQQAIVFSSLALVIIDEQHRFGVAQRKILLQKGSAQGLVPHFLSLTATPIPRSLALTLYGDLDLSILKLLPAERKKIITEIINPVDRQRCYDFIRQEIKSGRQVFVLCPLIDPADRLGVKSVTEEFEKLSQQVLPEFTIALVHGKLKPQIKQQVMADFLAKKSDILVATSVIEVGIDIPNATVMMVEGAERFGLGQLHQFRGRVGRSEHQSYCFLLTDQANQKTLARLGAMVTAQDGFELAEKDLELRGPGELFGVNQSGWPEFKLATLFDYEIMLEAKKMAETFLSQESNLERYPFLQEKIKKMNPVIHRE